MTTTTTKPKRLPPVDQRSAVAEDSPWGDDDKIVSVAEPPSFGDSDPIISPAPVDPDIAIRAERAANAATYAANMRQPYRPGQAVDLNPAATNYMVNGQLPKPPVAGEMTTQSVSFAPPPAVQAQVAAEQEKTRIQQAKDTARAVGRAFWGGMKRGTVETAGAILSTIARDSSKAPFFDQDVAFEAGMAFGGGKGMPRSPKEAALRGNENAAALLKYGPPRSDTGKSEAEVARIDAEAVGFKAAPQPETGVKSFRPPTLGSARAKEIQKGIQRLTREHPDWQTPQIETAIGLMSQPEALAGNLGAMVPYMAGTTAAFLAGGASAGPGLAFLVGYAVEGDGAYHAALADGATEDQARLTAAVYGTAAGLIEQAQVDKFLHFGKSAAKTAATKQLSLLMRAKILAGQGVKLAATEGLQEITQGATQDVTGAIVYNKKQSIGDFINQRSVEGLLGAIAGLGGGGVAAGVNLAVNRVAGPTVVPAPEVAPQPGQVPPQAPVQPVRQTAGVTPGQVSSKIGLAPGGFAGEVQSGGLTSEVRATIDRHNAAADELGQAGKYEAAAEARRQAEKAAAEAKTKAETSGATPPPIAEQVVAPSAKGGATAPEPPATASREGWTGSQAEVNWDNLPWEVRTKDGSRLFFAQEAEAKEVAERMGRVGMIAEVVPFSREGAPVQPPPVAPAAPRKAEVPPEAPIARPAAEVAPQAAQGPGKADAKGRNQTPWEDAATGERAILHLYRGEGGIGELTPEQAAKFGRSSLLGDGLYATPSKTLAAPFGKVRTVRVVLDNPYVIDSANGGSLKKLDIESIKAQGHDGIIIKKGQWGYGAGQEDLRQVVIFSEHVTAKTEMDAVPPPPDSVMVGATVRVVKVDGKPDYVAQYRSKEASVVGQEGVVTKMSFGTNPTVKIGKKTYDFSAGEVELVPPAAPSPARQAHEAKRAQKKAEGKWEEAKFLVDGKPVTVRTRPEGDKHRARVTNSRGDTGEAIATKLEDATQLAAEYADQITKNRTLVQAGELFIDRNQSKVVKNGLAKGKYYKAFVAEGRFYGWLTPDEIRNLKKQPPSPPKRSPKRAESAQAEAEAQPGGKAETPEGKQPWEMTKAKYIAEQARTYDKRTKLGKDVADQLETAHRQAVKRAAQEGKVSADVLADYKGRDWADAALAKMEKPEGKVVAPVPAEPAKAEGPAEFVKGDMITDGLVVGEVLGPVIYMGRQKWAMYHVRIQFGHQKGEEGIIPIEDAKLAAQPEAAKGEAEWAVTVTKKLKIGNRTTADDVERTLYVRAKTAKAAEKAVRDSGVSEQIVSIEREPPAEAAPKGEEAETIPGAASRLDRVRPAGAESDAIGKRAAGIAAKTKARLPSQIAAAARMSPVFAKYGFTAKDAEAEGIIVAVKRFTGTQGKETTLGYRASNAADSSDLLTATEAVEDYFRRYGKASAERVAEAQPEAAKGEAAKGDYGKSNTHTTAEDAAKAQKVIDDAREAARKKPHTRRGGFAAVPDPEVLKAYVTKGMYHAEAIIRKLGKLTRRVWTAAMREDLPDMKPGVMRQVWGEIVKVHKNEIRQIVKEAETAARTAVPPPAAKKPAEPEEGPKRDTTQLTERAVNDAVAKGMGVDDADLSTYEVQTRKQWTEDALALDPDQAIRIVMGEEDVPAGIKIAAVFETVKWRAIADGDMALFNRLKTAPVGEILSKHGQEIAAAGIRNPLDPFEAIKEIETAGAEAAAKRHGKVDPKVVAELQAKVDEAYKVRDEAVAKLQEQERQRAMGKADRKMEGEVKAKQAKPRAGKNVIFTDEMNAQADIDIRSLLTGVHDITHVAPMTAKLIKALAVKAGWYIEKGGRNFARWTAAMVNKFGPEIEPHLKQAWADAEAQLKPKTRETAIEKIKTTLAGEGGTLAKAQQSARDLYRIAIEDGIQGVEARLDAVHGQLEDTGVTREEVRDAVSGYGKTTQPSQEALEVELRENMAQHRELAKLRDMAEGQAPLATGMRFDKPSQEVRDLQKQVADAKKRGGYEEPVDPTRQLQSALDTIRTRLTNENADLLQQIAAGKRTIRDKTAIELTPDLKALKARVVANRAILDALDPKRTTVTDAQKIDRAMKYSDRRNKALEAKLASGDYTKPVRPTWRDLPESPAKAEALDSQRKADSLAAKVRALKGMVLTPEQTKNIVDLARGAMKAETAMRDGPRRKIGRNPNTMEAAYGLAKIRFDRYVADLRRAAESMTWEEFKTFSAGHKVLTATEISAAEIAKAVNIGRSLMASMDDSGVLRQSYRGITADLEDVASLIPRAFGYKGHQGPRFVWIKAVGRSFKAIWDTFGGKAVRDAVQAGIISSPTYDKKVIMGIVSGGQEEVFAGSFKIADDITAWATRSGQSIPNRVALTALESPWIAFKASENAYHVLLHSLRDQLADRALAIAERKGWDTNDPRILKGLGRIVNTQTATAAMKSHPLINFLMWTPKMLYAHVEFLTAGLLSDAVRMTNPKLRGDIMPWRIRVQAAKQLAEFVGMTAGILMIAKLIDPDSVDLEDWSSLTSADLGKIKYGNTSIDVTGGGAALVTLAARIAMWKSKSTTTGKVTALNTGEDGSKNVYDVIMDFIGNKYSPLVGEAVQFAKGEDRSMPRINGKPQKPTVLRSLGRQFTPMPAATAKKLWNDPKAAPFLAAMLADVLGASTNTYYRSPPIAQHFRTEFSEMVEIPYKAAAREDKPVPAGQQAEYHRMSGVNDLLGDMDKLAQDTKTSPDKADTIRRRQELIAAAALSGRPVFSVVPPANRHEFAYAYSELYHTLATKALTGSGLDRTQFAATRGKLDALAAKAKVIKLDELKTKALGSVRGDYTDLFHKSLAAGDVEAGVAYYRGRVALAVDGEKQMVSLSKHLDNPNLKPEEKAKILATWKLVQEALRKSKGK